MVPFNFHFIHFLIVLLSKNASMNKSFKYPWGSSLHGSHTENATVITASASACTYPSFERGLERHNTRCFDCNPSQPTLSL